jgi:hypothetical protein
VEAERVRKRDENIAKPEFGGKEMRFEGLRILRTVRGSANNGR